jgi:hypothetical protein
MNEILFPTLLELGNITSRTLVISSTFQTRTSSFFLCPTHNMATDLKSFGRTTRATQQRFPGLFRKAPVGASPPKRGAGFLVPRDNVRVFQELPVWRHPHFRPGPEAGVRHAYFLVVGVHGEAEHEWQPPGCGRRGVPKNLGTNAPHDDQ